MGHISYSEIPSEVFCKLVTLVLSKLSEISHNTALLACVGHVEETLENAVWDTTGTYKMEGQADSCNSR